jgi:hypothetical protein
MLSLPCFFFGGWYRSRFAWPCMIRAGTLASSAGLKEPPGSAFGRDAAPLDSKHRKETQHQAARGNRMKRVKLAVLAHFGHRDHSDRSIVISEIGGS